MGISGVPFRSVGASTPVSSSRVGRRSTTWAYWRRSSPRAARPSGHENTNGTEWPPAWVFSL